MRMVSRLFPGVDFRAICTKHNCPVEIRLQEAKSFHTKRVEGGQITGYRCSTGGAASFSDESCDGHWEIHIVTPGDITIKQ